MQPFTKDKQRLSNLLQWRTEEKTYVKLCNKFLLPLWGQLNVPGPDVSQSLLPSTIKLVPTVPIFSMFPRNVSQSCYSPHPYSPVPRFPTAPNPCIFQSHDFHSLFSLVPVYPRYISKSLCSPRCFPVPIFPKIYFPVFIYPSPYLLSDITQSRISSSPSSPFPMFPNPYQSGTKPNLVAKILTTKIGNLWA